MEEGEGITGLRANLYSLAAVVIFLARLPNTTSRKAKREHNICAFSPCNFPCPSDMIYPSPAKDFTHFGWVFFA